MATTTRTAPKPWYVAAVAGMASYIDAAAIIGSGTALVLYQQSVGLSPDQIGWLSSALTFGIAIGAFTGGRLGDRFGRRSVFIVTMAMIAVGAGLLVFSVSFVPLLIGTALLGLGTGADLPVSLATIAEAGTDKNRGKLIAFSQMLWFAGILFTTLLQMQIGGLGRLGGQILYAHVGIMAVIVLILRLTVPESASWSTARAERAAGVQTIRAQEAGVGAILRNKVFLIPFLALIGFYSLINLAANTKGQFGSYIAVNVVGDWCSDR